MNWGYKILILYLGFVLLILTMVRLTMNQTVDLESKDYYEQELKFQDKIDKQNRANKLAEPLTWEVKPGTLTLKFPQEFKGKPVSGNINFFRPSDASLDKTIAVVADSTAIQSVSLNTLKSGMYKIRINWNVENTEYYNEGVINVN